MKLRIGVGEEDGFTKIKSLSRVQDETVEYLYSAFHFHRLSAAERTTFMNRAYRALKPGGQLTIVTPHANSMRAISDPLATWPPLCESSYMVYSKAWREQEGMADMPLTCDFGAQYGYGYQLDPDIAVRNEEYRAHATKHFVNVVLDLHVTLTKA